MGQADVSAGVPAEGLGKMTFEGPFQLKGFYDSWIPSQHDVLKMPTHNTGLGERACSRQVTSETTILHH